MDEEVVISGVNDGTFPDLSGQDQIQDLQIIDNPDLTTFRTLPPNLDSLYIQNCENLLEIPDLPDSLQHINIEDCRSLRRIPVLQGNLRSITITNCASLREIPHLPDSLEHIYIEKCDNLHSITIFPNDVTNIMISNCASLEAIPDLPSYLRVLNISYCDSLRIIPELPRDLESFSVTNLPSLQAIPVLPLHLVIFDVSSCPLAKIQSLPTNLIHFICNLDQLDELCKNETFLQSIMDLLEHDDFVISRPGKNPTDEEKQVFIEKIREIIRYKEDTEAALEVPLQSASDANRDKRITKVFEVAGREILAHTNPYTKDYNQSLVESAKQQGQSIVDRREGSAQGSASASNLKLGGRKSKKQKRSKKSKLRKRKYTKKRRRTTKK
jgi:hypothetical protein